MDTIDRPFIELRYTEEDSERANRAWKATCGPHSIAAALGIHLEQVRPHIPNYRGWMSPTQMTETLKNLGRNFNLTKGLKTSQLCNGINRVQWEGPWLNPGVPARVAYFQTHYVAHFNGYVLCTACLPARWIPAREWREFHLSSPPPSPFHITHHWTI